MGSHAGNDIALVGHLRALTLSHCDGLTRTGRINHPLQAPAPGPHCHGDKITEPSIKYISCLLEIYIRAT